jgi:putative membrane protein
MTLILQHWSADPVVLTGYVIVAVVHLRGLRALPGAPGDGLHAALRRQAILFQCGWAAVLLALVSPLGYWSSQYAWAHATQDVIAAGVAAPLLVLGAPWVALRWGVPGGHPPGKAPRWGVPGGHPPGTAPRWGVPGHWGYGGLRQVAQSLASPVGATVVFNAAWIGWRVAPAYDLTARSATVHYIAFAMFLGFAVLLWLQLVGSRPWSPSWPPVRRIPLAFFSGAANFVLVMVFALSPSVLYPAYAATGSLPASADQQFAGAIMWVGLEPAFIVFMTFAAYSWLTEQEEDPTYGLAALLRRRTSGWESPLSLGNSMRNKNRHPVR